MQPASLIETKIPPRPAKDVPILLAGQADRRRIDDGHHLFQVIERQPVEQRFVAILQADHENVALEVGRFSANILQHALDLLLLGMHPWWEQSAQP